MTQGTRKFWCDTLQDEPWPIYRHVFVIAEIGINHNGEVALARKLIDMAKQAGCDAVKFQKRTIDVVYTNEFLNSMRESPWGTTQREQKEALEFGEREYAEIDSYCRSVGIEWFASAWDVESQRFLRRYEMRYNKVASAMITHEDLLKTIAEERKPTFISTGMSGYESIDRAVDIFKRQDCPFILMHTVSEYPAHESTLNLMVMLKLRKRYGCAVGYSGHEVTMIPSMIAVAMGAAAVERHITLDRAMYGSDQAASLEKRGLEMMVDYIRTVPIVVGNGVKKISETEMKNAEKLRYWRPKFNILKK